MDLRQVAALLLLLAVANGAPVIAARIFGDKLARPLDGGLRLADGQPLFGRSKTIRGVVLSLFVTTLAAPLLGMTLWIGAVGAAAAMAGDLLSSFVKRRLRLQPSSMAIGLDQIPESLFPALACRMLLRLSALDIVLVVVLFLVVELVLSRALFALGIRDRPY